MRHALIDNATLTAVQRLLGEIPVKNKALVDMDMLCLESYIEAILFYDTLVFLDDYKEEYRSSRRAFFSQMMPIVLQSVTYDALLARAKTVTEDIVPRVEGGQFTDGDFRPFFKLLRMNVTFTWDMVSSVYYLTQKMLESVGGLDLDKYSKLSAAIYDGLVEKDEVSEDAKVGIKYELVDSRGNPIRRGYKIIDQSGAYCDAHLSKQVLAFFASLNWLAFRTTFYTLAAMKLGTDLFLHPIRHSFQVNLLPKLTNISPSTFKPIIDSMNSLASDTINRVLSATQPFVTAQEVPMFTAWLAEKVADPRCFIEAAYEMRQEKLFVQARQQLIKLEQLLESNDHEKFVIQANKLVAEIQKQMDRISSKYKITTPRQVPISNLITLWNISTLLTGLPNVPDLDIRLPGGELVSRMLPPRGFKGVYKALVSDLIRIGQLGKLYDRIASAIVLDPNAEYYLEKVEEEQFSRYKSWWKVPM